MNQEVTRDEIHRLIDGALDSWKLQERFPWGWANISFNFIYEKGTLKVFAKERETQKEIERR